MSPKLEKPYPAGMADHNAGGMRTRIDLVGGYGMMDKKLTDLENKMLKRLEIWGYVSMKEATPSEANALRQLCKKGFATGCPTQGGPAWRLK